MCKLPTELESDLLMIRAKAHETVADKAMAISSILSVI
jgi:hypothetical protein